MDIYKTLKGFISKEAINHICFRYYNKYNPLAVKPLNKTPMWFKQMTCDCCFTPLDSIGRHNRYYLCKIQEFEKLTPRQYQFNYDYYNNPNEIRINYDTSPYSYNGFVYCYKIDQLSPRSYSTWFCSRQCALNAAKKMNALAFYYDEEEQSVAFITPHIVEINRAIHESDYTPLLMMDWGEHNWFQKLSDYKDLSLYGFDTSYPTFSTRLCNVVKPSVRLLNGYKRLVLDPDFQKDFWGSNGAAISNHINNSLPNFMNHVDVDFGRRLMIEWFITNKNEDFIGFIHLTCMSNAFPYKWVVEFGLVKEYRGKKIMKTVLRGILNWAKNNGCDKIYAISEEHNHPAHALFNNLPFNVTENRTHMSDQFGGFRPMRNYIVNL